MVDTRKTAKKIVIMGLDAAGKSSILNSLKNDTRLSSYIKLEPTLDINRGVVSDNNNEFFIFDFAGQENLRNEYIKDLDRHLTGVDKVIFVIDVHDTTRHAMALDYLEKIIHQLELAARHVSVSVFLHKYDYLPGGTEDRDMAPVAQSLVESLMVMVPKSIPVEIFRTSISAMFQKIRLR